MDVLEHISEKPWGDYSEADYTLAQWHAACLIHQHIGPPTSKSQCKLPVKTPNGALNRNGVHAAAAALAGARTPINASPEEKAKAAAALRRFYIELKEVPPPSLVAHSSLLEGGEMTNLENVDDILKHVGVKGMRWGVRKSESSVTVSDRRKKLKTSGGARRPAHPDAVRARTIGQVGKASGLKALSNEELQTYAHRLQLEQNVKRLNYNEMNPGKKFVAALLGRSGNSLASEAVNTGTKKLGKRAVKFAMA